MSKVTTDAPDSLKESLPENMSEQDAYKTAQKINNEDKNHHAIVTEGKLKVQQVLRG